MLPTVFLDELDRAMQAGAAEQAALLRRLAEDADAVIPVITSDYHAMRRWSGMFTLLQVIGYPRNAPALPWMVDHIDRNSSAAQTLVALLSSIPVYAVTPHIIQRLLAPHQTESWGYDVESLCATLQELAPDYTLPCVPALVHVLEHVQDPLMLDVGFIIDTIERTGPVGAAQAAPALLFVMRTHTAPETAQQARAAFASLPTEIRKLYALVAGSPEMSA